MLNLKERVLQELDGVKITKVRYYKESPYMKRRYKPEFVQQEVWIYTNNIPAGYLVTEDDFNNEEYRKGFFDMIRGEN